MGTMLDRPAIDAPSIVDAIRKLYEHSARRKPSTGYPTGSRLGTCAAQLQMLRFPEVSHPEITPIRTVMSWDEGKRTEEWLATTLQLAYPELVGLRQEPFFFPVPLEPGMVDDVAAQIRAPYGAPRRLWGTVMPGFRPPTIRVGDDGRVKLKLIDRVTDPNTGASGPRRLGFVLDPVARVVWIPTYVDFLLLHPRHGLMVLEAKSQSNWAFRRAVVGALDYQKRAQLAGLRAATGAQPVLIAYRKETHHLAEIAYLLGTGTNRVVLTRPNGQQDTFFPEVDGLRPASGGPAAWPPDATWEQAAAEIWTPDDPALLAAIHDRVRAVLLAQPGAWRREYGPAFLCQKCGGAGQRACRTCKGTGVTPKLGKPCGGECKDPGWLTRLDERAPGMIVCSDCAGQGRLAKAELGYPCSYCPCIAHCYGSAGVRLEIDTKPHYYLDRGKYESAGLSFVSPESKPPTDSAEPDAAA